jgi:hypothetical protein
MNARNGSNSTDRESAEVEPRQKPPAARAGRTPINDRIADPTVRACEGSIDSSPGGELRERSNRRRTARIKRARCDGGDLHVAGDGQRFEAFRRFRQSNRRGNTSRLQGHRAKAAMIGILRARIGRL